MCGISGIYNLDGASVSLRLLKGMADALSHRGPDDSGYMVADTRTLKGLSLGSNVLSAGLFPDADLGFAHRRLSIIDLSPAAHQPMSNGDGTLWIVYNGEIFNYVELRDELRLKGRRFTTVSDTEVILQAYKEWGGGCLRRFNGMFSFSIWDAVNRRLFCARDRFGIKPFYYYADSRKFSFASEIKALLCDPAIDRTPDGASIGAYLTAGRVDFGERTFFSSIKQLLPAHCMTVGKEGLVIERWWDVPAAGVTTEGRREYTSRYGSLFSDSVRLRLRSDVPVGSCLSGGLDSSAVACAANSILFPASQGGNAAGGAQKTFSACFDEALLDERPYIGAIVDSIRADAHYTFPDGKKLFDELPALVFHQDEPFSTTSIYAQWEVMKLAAQSGVKVLLDGQGADEALGGYHLFFEALYRDMLKSHEFTKFIGELLSYRRRHGRLPAGPIINILSSAAPNAITRFVKSLFGMDCEWLAPPLIEMNLERIETNGKFASALDNILYAYLTRDNLPALLRYEDRNSMAFSIESRLPFLDYRLIELAFTLPPEAKLNKGVTKMVLRDAMEGKMPERVRCRMDKIGFQTPEDAWFRTVARGRIYDVIDSAGFKTLPYFNHKKLRAELDRHMRGSKNIGSTIWRWVNLHMWIELVVKRATHTDG